MVQIMQVLRILLVLGLALSTQCHKPVIYRNRGAGLQSLPVDEIPAEVTILILNNNSLEYLQDNDFGLYPYLQEISLKENLLYHIEPFTFNGSVVKILDLSCNSLTTIPLLYGLEDNLETLRIVRNDIYLIDQTLAGFINLTDLNFQSNTIEKVSPLAFCGTSLHYLDLNENQLNVVPELACVGETLTTLLLGKNIINQVQREDFEGLLYLKTLSLIKNGIASIGNDTFLELSSLEILYLGQNFLTHIHPKAFTHSPMQQIHMDNSDLTAFPALGELNKTLSVVNILPSNNGLQDLTNLKGVYLPRLSTLQLVIGESMSLPTVNVPVLKTLTIQCMDMCDSPFTNLQLQLSILPSLKSLKLIGTSFDGIPGVDCLANGTNLQTLALTDGMLQTVNGTALNDLQNLTLLHLARNKLRTISPESFAQIGTTLEQLDLSDNPSLGDLGEDFYTTLQKVKILNLDNTSLTIFPQLSSIKSTLAWLSLNHNNILAFEPNHVFILHSLTEILLVDSLAKFQTIPDLSYLMTYQSLSKISVSAFLCNCSTVWLFDLIAAGDKRVQASTYPCQLSWQFNNNTVSQIPRHTVCRVEDVLHPQTTKTMCTLLCGLKGNHCHGYKYVDTRCYLELMSDFTGNSAASSDISQTFCRYDKKGSENTGTQLSRFKCTHLQGSTDEGT